METKLHQCRYHLHIWRGSILQREGKKKKKKAFKKAFEFQFLARPERPLQNLFSVSIHEILKFCLCKRIAGVSNLSIKLYDTHINSHLSCPTYFKFHTAEETSWMIYGQKQGKLFLTVFVFSGYVKDMYHINKTVKLFIQTNTGLFT